VLASTHLDFALHRHWYNIPEKVTALRLVRHDAAVEHFNANDDWGWDACTSCRIAGTGYIECRGYGQGRRAHGVHFPDAGS